ncbi:uncharacterized protein TNCV_2908831 [Trichonephila clavipes]|nr:uncharacterized protein TNCV_2908831 [Trichonephila clavipes]
MTKLDKKVIYNKHEQFLPQNTRLCKSPDFHAKCSTQGFNCMYGCKVLLQSVLANINACMWFQHDGASAHFSTDVQSVLNTVHPGRWIARGGLVNWQARSPDLSCLDFFLWSHMKSLVYSSPVDTETRPWLRGLPSW